MLRLRGRRDDAVADGVSGTDDGALHLGAVVHVEHVRDARRRVPLLGRDVLGRGRRLVRFRGLRLDELRVLLRPSDRGAECRADNRFGDEGHHRFRTKAQDFRFQFVGNADRKGRFVLAIPHFTIGVAGRDMTCFH